jgi:hypothetical protein
MVSPRGLEVSLKAIYGVLAYWEKYFWNRTGDNDIYNIAQ